MNTIRSIFTALSLAGLVALAPVSTGQNAPVYAKHGMVVSASQYASEAGAEIMRRGGNAFDAGTVVGFVLAVTWPRAGNLGGGGFMVAHTSDGENISLDFRETAPARAHRDMYLDEEGEVMPGLSLRSAIASGVPGSVDGLLRMWRDHGSGTLTRKELLAPAIAYASEGFAISKGMAASLNGRAAVFAGTANVFIRDDGEPWKEGDVLIQSDLAKTLRRIAEQGAPGFYSGEVAKLIADQQARTAGLITLEDLANYRSIYRAPVVGTFLDYEIISMGPPSSGGILLVQMLNTLERHPLAHYGPGSTAYVHLLTEVQRRAYADRAEHLGDPDFWNIPQESLTSKEYARARAQTIDMQAATPSTDVYAGGAAPKESPETSHYSVVDEARNSVAITITLNGAFGSGIMIEGAGFLMNNEMDDFSIKPGTPNLYGLIGGDANAIEPGKRMLSSMTPTVVLKNGNPHLIVGSPGGSTIITTVLQVILNATIHGMNIQEAVDAPRHHSQWLPDFIRYEEDALNDGVSDALVEMGHPQPTKSVSIGIANSIMMTQDGIYGAPDPRSQNSAIGY